ncbi:MAG: HipA domain-containing protein [Crocinitomicaceae bacterium]
MARCLYCYKELEVGQVDYHPKCVKVFFGTEKAPELPYQLSEMEKLAKSAAEQSVTVPGVQPKLSLGWIKNEFEKGSGGRLTILDALDGHFILKPQNLQYPEMPENEHLSMKLASLFKLDIVPISMIRLASGELCFITKRIDRNSDGTKNHMIDFLQILELSDKYKGTMENLGKEIGILSVNTLQDKLRFFEVTLFSFVIGNNDMHLKNFSMFLSEMGWVLAPFYDLLNVKLVLPKDKDDSALLLGGKKQNFKKGYFDRLGRSLELNDKQINSVYKRLKKWLPDALEMIDHSFLSEAKKREYKNLVVARIGMFEDL